MAEGLSRSEAMNEPSSFQPTLPLAPFGDTALRDRVQAALDAKTKPRGALGRLEALALQLALIQRREQPRLQAPQLVVFAADHGIAAQRVSARHRRPSPRHGNPASW